MQWAKYFKFIQANLLAVSVLAAGVICIGVGIFSSLKTAPAPAEMVIEPPTVAAGEIVVDIAGAVQKPGVYHLNSGERLVDLIEAAGGFTDTADPGWVAQRMNQAEKLKDGQKIYIPTESTGSPGTSRIPAANEGRNQASEVAGAMTVGINSATAAELEDLWGVGEARARAIIDNRPYSSIDELVNKARIPQNVLDENQARLSLD